MNNEIDGFRIVCDCGRKICDYVFTTDGDLVITCKTCKRTTLIARKDGEGK